MKVATVQCDPDAELSEVISLPADFFEKFDVRSVPCPMCGAAPGKNCIGSKGRERKSSHNMRHQLHRANNPKPEKKPVGRPPGTKTGLRPGSVAHRIAQLKKGDRLTLTVPANKRVTSYMGQIGADIGRSGMRGRVRQQHALFIVVATREVSDVVVVECIA